MPYYQHLTELQINQSKVWKKLYFYQKDTLLKLQHHYKFILGLEAGMGKTLTSIAWLDIHFRYIAPNAQAWVVCPKSKVEEWAEDITNEDIEVNVVLLNKTTKQNAELINENKFVPKTVFVTGFTMYGLLHKEKILPQAGTQYLIVDECQKLNGKNAKVANAVIKMVNERRITKIALLSGTLHSTGYQDLANITVLLGIYKNIYHFQNKHLNFKKIGRDEDKLKILDPRDPYKNIDLLINRLNANGVLLKKDGILENRKINEINVVVPRNQEYLIMRDHGIVDDFYAPNGGTKFMMLRMLASNFLSTRNDNRSFEQFKLKGLEAVLTLPNIMNERVLIFYERTQEFKDIKTLAKKLGRPLSYINGSGHNRDKFNNNDNGIIAIQYQSGSEGINGLQIANNTVYYSPTLSGGLFEQSQKRTDRIGQKSNEVNYYYLISKNTLEQDIYSNLRKYQSYTEKIFTNNKNSI